MSSYAPEAAAAIGALVGLLIVLAMAWRDRRRARRNDEQLIDHIRLDHGMREAQRRGWLPDDLQ